MDVKTLCLGVLSMGDASGYEIRNVFEDAFSHFYVAGFGSIYPALAELTREGYATCENIEQEKRPAKKVYHITEKGMEAFRVALAETYPGHKVRSDFMVQLVFAHMLEPERLVSVLQQRLSDINETLAHIDNTIDCQNCQQSKGSQFAAGFARAVLLAGKEYIEQHKDEFIGEIEKKDKKP